MTDQPEKFPALNVLDQPLIPCSFEPLTGYYRDGCCDTGPQDHGSHTVCTEVTDEFLQFSASRGNDLTTPVPDFNFPGLVAGDNWCLCAARWKEAWQAGCAPGVVLHATNKAALRIVALEELLPFAIDVNTH